MKSAIVTGANGFLGSAVCRELSHKDYDIIALIRDKSSCTDCIADISGLSFLYLSMDQYENISKVIDKRNVDIFFHFAWHGCSGNARSDYRIQVNNIKQSCEAAKQAKLIGCSRFVFAGSIMENEVISTASHNGKMGANTIYSTAKVAADYMTRAILNDSKTEYIPAIISNIYGPGEVSERLINSTIKKLINGEHCSFTTSEQMYDFIYIDDAARAFVDIGEKGVSGKSYYIGNRKPYKLKEYLSMLRDIVAPNMELGIGELGESNVILDYEKIDTYALNEDIGFEPQISFPEGIRLTESWIRKSLYEGGNSLR